jgi:hypothetical protein
MKKEKGCKRDHRESFPMYPSRLGEDGIPITCLEDDFLLYVDSKP